MVRHLEEKLLIGNSQHGFRKGRSCLLNLLSFLDKVTGSVDSGNSIDVIFLDFAKAFDKVPHKRLILKLESHGISGEVLQWVSAAVFKLGSADQRGSATGSHGVRERIPKSSNCLHGF